MTPIPSKTLSFHTMKLARIAVPLVSAVLLAACGGGGEVVVATPGVTASNPRVLSPEFSARTAVAYSPFRSGNRDTEVVTKAMIKQDLDLVRLAGFGLIRLYDSSVESSTCVNFLGANVGALAFGNSGGGSATLATDPLDATNKVVKIVKKPGDQLAMGAQIFTNAASGQLFPDYAITLTGADVSKHNKVVTVRVFSPTIGEKIRLRLEKGTDGAADQEVDVITTTANAWETLSFTFASAGKYKGVRLLPHADTAVVADTSFYFDELRIPAPAPVGPAGTAASGSTAGCIGYNEMILQVIDENKATLDLKVMLGAYIASESSPYISAAQKLANRATNRSEVAHAAVLAQKYKDIVLAVSVGNETMVSWTLNPTDPRIIAAYIATVRSQITQPVTTDDNWAFYAEAPKVITDVIDFAAMHTYAELDSVFNAKLWDWKQQAVAEGPARAAAMMKAAFVATQKDYQAVRDKLDRVGLSAMPIAIGETGWNAVNAGALSFRAHPVNQKIYFDMLNDWYLQARRTGAGPLNVFHFEAFDEPWKGNDDKWGMFNASRQARFVIQSRLPAGGAWVPEPVVAGDTDGVYSTADALSFVPLKTDLNPTTVNPVTANRYMAFADVTPVGAVNVGATLKFDAFGNNSGGVTAAIPTKPGAAEPLVPGGDGGNGIEITPTPETYGWGVLLHQANAGAADDLSAFVNGTLNFSIQTTYAGKIEIGFSTGSAATTDLVDVWMPISPGQYGYQNDGAWHKVSIPISALVPFAAKGFGMNDSLDAVLDLKKVQTPFVIADRYDHTGKDQGSGITTKINIDAIFWGK